MKDYLLYGTIIAFWYFINRINWIDQSWGPDRLAQILLLHSFYTIYPDARIFLYALNVGISVPILRYPLLCAYLVPIYVYSIKKVLGLVSAQIEKMIPSMP